MFFHSVFRLFTSKVTSFLQFLCACMNVNVHTDSCVNKDCSGLDQRNIVASWTRLMLYSHLDNNDDDDKIITIDA